MTMRATLCNNCRTPMLFVIASNGAWYLYCRVCDDFWGLPETVRAMLFGNYETTEVKVV